MLALCHRFFKRVVFFIVREPWVLGWSGLGEGMDRSLAASLRIPLDQPSVFQTVVRATRPSSSAASRPRKRTIAS